MTLHQLEIIVAVINSNLNVSVAGKKLGRVQSSVSHQLYLIEKELGGKLFERYGKRLTKMTPLCKRLLPEIEKVLQAKSNLLTISRESVRENQGYLRIATTHTQARYFLPGVINNFRSSYPKVKLIFHLGNPEKFSELLKQREIDVAIFAEEQDVLPELKEIKCYSWNRALVVCHDHPLARAELDLEKIADYPMVTYMQGFADRYIIEKTFREAGINIDVVFSASDTDVIKTYVRLKLGVGIVAQMAQDPSIDQDLTFRKLDHLFENSTTRVVFLKNQVLMRYVKDFINLLHEYGREFEAKLK